MQSNPTHTDEIQHQFNTICHDPFRHRTPYQQWQSGIGTIFLRAYDNSNVIMMRMLLVRPTGGGKTLFFNTIVVCLKGTTLCISPLLSLGADQTRKVMESAHDDRFIVAYFHLDEMSQESIKQLLSSLKVLPSDKTVFIFTSPQAIVNHNDELRDYLITNKLIRFIVVNDIHLVNHFGKTFRSARIWCIERKIVCAPLDRSTHDVHHSDMHH